MSDKESLVLSLTAVAKECNFAGPAYLKAANSLIKQGLIKYNGNGSYQITDKGRKAV